MRGHDSRAAMASSEALPSVVLPGMRGALPLEPGALALATKPTLLGSPRRTRFNSWRGRLQHRKNEGRQPFARVLAIAFLRAEALRGDDDHPVDRQPTIPLRQHALA